MLVVGKQRAVHVPLFLLGFTSLMFGLGVVGTIKRSHVGSILMTLVTGGFAVVVLGEVRVLTVDGVNLHIRSPFSRRRLDQRRATVATATRTAGRGGVVHLVCVSDGSERLDVSEHWSQAQAAAAAARLTRMIGHGDPAVRAQLSAERHEFLAAQAHAQAQVDAYYKSKTWRRLPLYILAGVLVYALVIFVAMQLR